METTDGSMREGLTGHTVSRRQVLRFAGAGSLGLLGVALAACSPNAPAAAPTSAPAAKPTTPPAAATSAPAPAPTAAKPAATAPAQQAPAAGGTSAAWDALVADAKKEGKVVVSGPPNDIARKAIPETFKQRYGIEVEYLGGNSSQLASRLQTERAAGQYTIDVSMGGSDTFYRTFLENNWIQPIKPILMLPEVVDPNAWVTGGPWFRDPERKDTIMQIFNTISPQGYFNADIVPTSEFTSADDLLDPKWKGKIASYNPSVNGAGVLSAAGLYASKGEEFIKSFWKNNVSALTRDAKQLADWVAHANYPVGIGLRPADVEALKDVIKIEELRFSDIKPVVAGGFGMIGLYNNAPHPNAAKVYVNWIATKEGTALYGKADASAPVRKDVDATAWLAPGNIPKPGQDVVDSYEYVFVTQTRAMVQEMLAPYTGGSAG